MAHTLAFNGGSYSIYVEEISDDSAPIIAEHQILDSSHTTLQYMGGKSLVKSLQYTTSGSATMNAIKGAANLGYQVYYTDDFGTSGSYVINKLTYKRMQALNYTDPWYRCNMTMIQIDGSGSLYYQWS